MPDVYQPGDAAWIQTVLAAMKSSTMRAYARDKYAYIYKLRWDEEPVSYRKGNAGAKAANTWLRLFFEKNHKSMQGYTEAPLLAPQAPPKDTAQT